jgi:hypothetical protein
MGTESQPRSYRFTTSSNAIPQLFASCAMARHFDRGYFVCPETPETPRNSSSVPKLLRNSSNLGGTRGRAGGSPILQQLRLRSLKESRDRRSNHHQIAIPPRRSWWLLRLSRFFPVCPVSSLSRFFPRSMKSHDAAQRRAAFFCHRVSCRASCSLCVFPLLFQRGNNTIETGVDGCGVNALLTEVIH